MGACEAGDGAQVSPRVWRKYCEHSGAGSGGGILCVCVCVWLMTCLHPPSRIICCVSVLW